MAAFNDQRQLKRITSSLMEILVNERATELMTALANAYKSECIDPKSMSPVDSCSYSTWLFCWVPLLVSTGSGSDVAKAMDLIALVCHLMLKKAQGPSDG